MMTPKINTVMARLRGFAFTTKFIAVTMVPGPARIGMASGEMAIPSSKLDSLSTCTLVFFECSISNPIKKMSTPPNTLKAGIVKPKIWKIY